MFSKGNKSSSAKSHAGTGTSPGVATNAAPSIISADLKITGNLASAGDLQIDGTVEGDITSRLVTVGQGALVQGAILANTVRIYGSVSGEIKANDVTLAKSARVDGDIGHQSIAMEAGASVSGRLTRLDKPVAAVETQAGGKPAGSGSTSPGAPTPGAGGSNASSSQNYSGYRA
jgi:cytoskeletal protein CcmA (bactofilin family)